MHRRWVSRFSTAAILCVAAAFAPAAHAEDVAPLAAISPVSAWGGQVVWSAFDGTAYHLMARSSSGVSALPVAPRPVPFDADVGPDRDGVPAVVYSRCVREDVRPTPGGVVRASLAAGCRIFKLRLTPGAQEHRVRATAGRGTSETTPAIWRGRIAFARRDERAVPARRSLTSLFTQARAGSRRLVGIPGGLIPACPPGQRCTELPVTSTASLDVNGERVTYLWWVSGPGINIGIAYEVRVATIGAARSRLLEARGYGESEDWCDGSPRAPLLLGGAVLWPRSSEFGSCTTTLVRLSVRSGRAATAPMPDSVLALASDGGRMFAALAAGPFGGFIRCGDPAFSCRLVDLPLPRFVPAYAPQTYSVSPCWRYRPDGRRYCVPNP